LTILLLSVYVHCCPAQESLALMVTLSKKIWTWWRTIHTGTSTLQCKAMAHSPIVQWSVSNCLCDVIPGVTLAGVNLVLGRVVFTIYYHAGLFHALWIPLSCTLTHGLCFFFCRKLFFLKVAWMHCGIRDGSPSGHELRGSSPVLTSKVVEYWGECR